MNEIVKSFIDNTIQKQDPSGLCFTVSLPLHLHLRNNGYPCSLGVGRCEDRDHFWVKLDNSDNIVDATILQFDFAKHLPSIYIGVKPNEFNEDLKPGWFNETVETWVSPFKVIGYPNADTLRSINISLAVHLNNEIRKLGSKFIGSDECQAYFSGIKDIILYMNDELWSNYKKMNGFCDLASDLGFDISK